MTALEQLRQGIGGVKLTSALDLLRQGVIEPPQADIFGMKTTTPAFIPPKPEQPKVSIKDVLREVPGVMGQAREAVRKNRRGGCICSKFICSSHKSQDPDS